jgi:hypothetical protein
MLTSVGQTAQPPNPEIPVLVFDLKTGNIRTNDSWLLARLVKTYERWMPLELKQAMRDPEMLTKDMRVEDQELGTSTIPTPSNRHALYVTIYEWDKQQQSPGTPARDWVWWSGLVVTIVQLGISAIPFALYDYWSVLLITACGSALAWGFSAVPGLTTLPRAKTGSRDVALSKGNGNLHVIIVLGEKAGLDLLSLSMNQSNVSGSVKVVRFVMGVLWILLLITSTAIRTRTWYLVAVGFIGMAHNLFLGAVLRQPKALGLPLQVATSTDNLSPEIISDKKVMWTLMELELKYKGFGKALLPEFFPGRLLRWEMEWWDSDNEEERKTLLKVAKEGYVKRRR